MDWKQKIVVGLLFSALAVIVLSLCAMAFDMKREQLRWMVEPPSARGPK